jgi:quercetin dioxygenase-like cupin family protein
MAAGLTPVRRVVTGNDARGRSRVVWDGPASNTHDYAIHTTGSGSGWTNVWVFDETPAPLAGATDDGNKPYEFPAAMDGAHWRVVEYRAPPPGYDRAKDPEVVPFHEPRKRPVGRAWDRGGTDAFSAPVHKTESVDFGFIFEGQRTLVLDDRELTMSAGDVVVQLGNWHGWRAVTDCRMAFVMISGSFAAEAHDARVPLAAKSLPDGVAPVRRIVTATQDNDRSTAFSDGPSPDVRLDPARPGFASTRIWVTDSMPAKIKVHETLHLPQALEPPPRGSVCRVLAFPPDDTWRSRVGAPEVQAYFAAMGSPSASTYSSGAPHPYMQRTRTLDFCLVLDGSLTLVLDTGEVELGAGDIVVQRGTNHAWSNRSGSMARLALVSHDGK